MPRNDLASRITRLVFPPVCAVCGVQRIEPDALCEKNFDDPFASHPFCGKCLEAMMHPCSIDICMKCGAEVRADSSFGNRCRLCFDTSLRFERAISVGSYRGVLQEVVIRMKQRQHEVLAFQAGQLLGLVLDKYDILNRIDLVVPVPTHWTRRIKRGCHVASMIAEGVSRQTGLRCSNRILIAARRTAKQGMLTGPSRRRNVQGAFSVRSKGSWSRVSIEGQRILLVDDVMTSGATASEAAWTLLKSGAGSVVAAVVARGEGVS